MVEIFSAWCGPSDAAISTIYQAFGKTMGRKIKFYQVRRSHGSEAAAKPARADQDVVISTRFIPGAASSQANTKDITELEKFSKDAKPRFLFYKDGAAPTSQPERAPLCLRTPTAMPWLILVWHFASRHFASQASCARPSRASTPLRS